MPSRAPIVSAPVSGPSLKRRHDGRIDIVWSDVGVALEGAGPSVRYRSGGSDVLWRPRHLEGDAVAGGAVARRGPLTLTLEAAAAESPGGTVVLAVRLRNDGDVPVHVDSLAPLEVAGDGALRVGAGGEDLWSIYGHGYQSWSGTGTYRVGDGDVQRDVPAVAHLRDTTTNAAHPIAGKVGRFRSELVTAIASCGQAAALCLGFLDETRTFGGFDLDASAGTLVAGCDTDGVALAPGEEWTSAPLWICAGSEGVELLERWAHAFGAAAGARVGERMPAGWCSWYYYFTKVTEADVLENLEVLAAHSDDLACDYVMVDDGHQQAIGDWLLTNDKFPSGMAAVAARIRDAGFDAGIWLAPFLVEKRSRLFADHPGWCVETERGGLRGAIYNPAWLKTGRIYALDTTEPEVLAWIEEVARTIVHEWGYRILKLDFLYAAALPGRRHDESATRAQALRRGLEAIRRGAGEDAFLLGCGCPFGPAVGIVDAMRIGADVSPWWTTAVSRAPWGAADRHGVATKHAVRDTLARSFMQRRLWFNDPDCLMVRTDRTRLSAAEVRSLAGVMGLADGMLVTSDRLGVVPPERLHLMRTAHALLGGRCRVEDLFDSDMPELLVSRYADGSVAVGVCNFADVARHRRVDVGRLGLGDGAVAELLCGGLVEVVDGVADLGELAPHDCRVLRWPTPGAGQPQP